MIAGRRQQGSSRFTLATCAIALVATMVACTASNSPPSSMAFFEGLRIGGDEAEGWATIGEMKSESDIVGTGTFTSFSLGRTIQGDAPEDVVAYGQARLQLDDTISGKAPDGQIVVEFVLPGDSADYAAIAKGLENNLPQGEVLVFLREKRGSNEAGLYRLVNSNGLWASTTRAPVDAPLADARVGDVYPEETGDLSDFEELVAYVESL